MRRQEVRSGWRAAACGCAVLVCVLGVSGAAQQARADEGEQAPRIVVDGSDWMESTSIQRQAFLVGVANMIVAEVAYAKRHGKEMPPVSDRVTRAVSDMKLAEIEERITRWYQTNPDRTAMPVMGVVWKDIVGR